MFKKILFLGFVAFGLGFFSDLQAQEVKEKTGNFSITTQMDNFLGFNVAFKGAYPISEKIDFTMAGTLFTSPNFGGRGIAATNGGNPATSTGLFAGIGPGLRFKFAEKKFAINPFVLIANGALLSGGRYGTGNSQIGNFGEGLIPGVVFEYKEDKITSSFLAEYFTAIRKSGPEQLQLARFTFLANYQVSKLVGLGILYDYLVVVGRPNNTATYIPTGGVAALPLPIPYDDFMFLGPSIDFTFAKNTKMYYAFGADFATPAKPAENGGRTFYRIGLTMSF